MIVLELPWIIGPVPILVTLWSFYDYATALRYREVAGGTHIAAAYLLPVGTISVIAQLLFSANSFSFVLVSSQLLSAVLAIYLLLFLNYISTGSIFLKKLSDARENKFGQFTIISLIIVIFTDVIGIKSHPLSACTIGKCYIIEYAFGSNTEIFSGLYLLGVLGAFFLSTFIGGVYFLFFKRRD